MPADSFLRLLQFTDGLFPAGGYAHSFGLETLVQSSRVQKAEDVAAFLREYLENSAAPTDAVAVLCTRTHALNGDLDSCIRLDRYLDALKSPAEQREASRQMGRQTLRILRELCVPSGHGFSRADHRDQSMPALAPEAFSSADIDRTCPDVSSHSSLATSHFCLRFATSVESGLTPCHHPVVFGLAAAVNGWEPRETASAFLYSTSAMIVGASLRLLPLGQLAGQRILAEAGTLIAALSETVLNKSGADMWSFTPELEIAAMRHESLDGRLFRS
jgi:urease accessory protein